MERDRLNSQAVPTAETSQTSATSGKQARQVPRPQSQA
jgi:hypothetical protein